MKTNSNTKKLYMIGGVADLGKSPIAKKFILEKQKRGESLLYLEGDFIRSIVRNGLMDDLPPRGIGTVTFEGSATYEGGVWSFKTVDSGEDILAGRSIRGLIRGFDDPRNTSRCDILVEGTAITSRLIGELKLNNFIIKEVFLGHSKPIEGKDPDGVRQSKIIEEETKRFGHKYFDMSLYPSLEKFDDEVICHLLKD